MKTYEGKVKIKWYKNDNSDVRAITIDCENRTELQKRLSHIRNEFNTKGDDKDTAYYRKWHDEYIPPYSITFDIDERV